MKGGEEPQQCYSLVKQVHYCSVSREWLFEDWLLHSSQTCRCITVGACRGSSKRMKVTCANTACPLKASEESTEPISSQPNDKVTDNTNSMARLATGIDAPCEPKQFNAARGKHFA
jgi:hypothetical protein